jgi:hypothetical protein
VKTHAPVSPQTPRGLRERRSLRGLLDTRRILEADLRHVEMVGPFGKDFFLVKNPGSSQGYVVANQTGGRTFKPGSAVILGSETGMPGEFVLGGAPAGKKGGVPTVKRRIPRGISQEANQFAFGDDGVDMWAMLYNDGTYISTRATIASVNGQYTGCILEDASELLGIGSLLMQDEDTLKVWDVESAAFYTYTTPVGWSIPTHLHYYGGFLYWCEVEDIPQASIGVGDPTFDIRLRRANTDLTGATTLQTVTSADASDFGLPFTTYVRPADVWTFAVDADGAVLYLGYEVTEIVNYEFKEWHGLQVRFGLGGGNASREWMIGELDGSDEVPITFFAATVGESFRFGSYQPGTHTVLAKADNATTAATDAWSTGLFDSGSSIQSLNANASGILQATVGLGNQVAYIFRENAQITNSIQPFDDVPNYPIAMYFFGE